MRVLEGGGEGIEEGKRSEGKMKEGKERGEGGREEPSFRYCSKMKGERCED
jgi:hypothetical protein